MKIHQIKYLNIGLRRFYTCCFNFFDCIMPIGVQFNLKYIYRRHNNFFEFLPWLSESTLVLQVGLWKTGAFKASVNIMFQLSLMIERKFNEKLNLDFAFLDEKEREREIGFFVFSSFFGKISETVITSLRPKLFKLISLSFFRKDNSSRSQSFKTKILS